ncbi:hypothetical protein JVX93_15745 [Mycolicibacterium boenickei]|nr:hypothetical protein JVX93_15745 [Mycolicibacterium boenickei]
MICIETKTHESGLREIRAVDKIGGVAIAIEHREHRPGREHPTYWHLSVVAPPANIRTPRLSYPEVDTEQEARAWVQFLGELTDRARQATVVRPVWCPNDGRQTVLAAALHLTERGLRLVSGGDE